jgi:hypothetical protein
MTLDDTWRRIALIVTLAVALPGPGQAGGAHFGDDDSASGGEGPSYFGFVREVGGAGIADAKVTVAPKEGGALVTHTDILGLYKIPALGKDINPDNVTISCAKDGYTQANVLRRGAANGDTKDLVEIECYLQKN